MWKKVYFFFILSFYHKQNHLQQNLVLFFGAGGRSISNDIFGEKKQLISNLVKHPLSAYERIVLPCTKGENEW